MTRAAADALTNDGQALLQEQRYDEAVAYFEDAIRVFPQHPGAWKGLAQARLCLGQAEAAAGAFDRAIGLGANGATALWGGAVAHAELGHRVIAQTYLRRALELQPGWIDMARESPALAELFELSWRAHALVRRALGTFSARSYRHADGNRALDVGRVGSSPMSGQSTYVSLGLCNYAWPQAERPRMELLLCSTTDDESCSQIVANTAFHLMDSGFFPEPGAMLRDVIGVLGGHKARQLPHGFISVPRAWKLRLPLELGPPVVSVAQLIPVSEAEYQVWRDRGPVELDRVLAQVNVADLSRRSAV